MPERSEPHPQESRRTHSRLFALVGFLAVVTWRKARGDISRDPSRQAVLANASERERERPMTAYEPTDWDIGPVALLYAGILALLVISCFALIAAYPGALPDVDRSKNISPPGPNLQTDPQSDLRQFRAKEETRLTTYYWVDKQNGTVHIPIDQAMQKLVATGIPGFPKAQQ